MAKKKVNSTKKPAAKPIAQGSREEKIMNAVVNTSIIMMGTLMGGFSEMMVNMTGQLASGMAETFGGQKAGDKVRSEMSQKLPKITDKMKNIITDMHKDICQMDKRKRETFPLRPTFDGDLGWLSPMILEFQNLLNSLTMLHWHNIISSG
jgi:hypothetical protein